MRCNYLFGWVKDKRKLHLVDENLPDALDIYPFFDDAEEIENLDPTSDKDDENFSHVFDMHPVVDHAEEELENSDPTSASSIDDNIDYERSCKWILSFFLTVFLFGPNIGRFISKKAETHLFWFPDLDCFFENYHFYFLTSDLRSSFCFFSYKTRLTLGTLVYFFPICSWFSGAWENPIRFPNNSKSFSLRKKYFFLGLRGR